MLKRKKMNKILSGILCTVVILTSSVAMTGCGSKEGKVSNDGTLDIVMPDLGYGTDWMEALAKAFTAKTGIKVNVDVTPTESGYTTQMRSGTAKYDIYLLRENTYSLVNANAGNLSGYDCILAELDDVYNSEIEGEGITFKDKMKDTYETYNRVDKDGSGESHYYAVQWCDSVFSLVRNMDVWQDNWPIPNTTDELLALCKTMKSTGTTPMIWSSQASYVWSSANLWVTQYQGLNDMYGEKGFWNCYSESGEANSAKMWTRKGILYAMEVVDQLVNDENGYSHTASTNVDFTTAQGYFLIPAQKVAMMSNGDWLYKEMVTNYSNANIDMMKMPIISAIIQHPDCENTIADDAELSALIKAIDNGATELKGEGYEVSQKAYDKVAEARKLYTCSSNINHIMVSPSYSNNLDIVKQFYLFMASDEGLKVYTENSGGFTLGFKTSDEVAKASESAANDFVKSTEALKRDGEVAPWPMYTNRLFAVGGLPVYPTIEMGYQFPELILSLEKKSGYMTPNEIFSKNYQNAVSKWSTFMKTAGVSK